MKMDKHSPKRLIIINEKRIRLNMAKEPSK